MAYGLQTFDGNGADNNTGIVRVLALGIFRVGTETSNSASFSLPSGYRMDYLFQSHQISGSANPRRRITISGNQIILTPAGNNEFAPDVQPAFAGDFLLYART